MQTSGVTLLTDSKVFRKLIRDHRRLFIRRRYVNAWNKKKSYNKMKTSKLVNLPFSRLANKLLEFGTRFVFIGRTQEHVKQTSVSCVQTFHSRCTMTFINNQTSAVEHGTATIVLNYLTNPGRR